MDERKYYIDDDDYIFVFVNDNNYVMLSMKLV